MGSYEPPASGVPILRQVIRYTWLGCDLHVMLAENKHLPSGKGLDIDSFSVGIQSLVPWGVEMTTVST